MIFTPVLTHRQLTAIYHTSNTIEDDTLQNQQQILKQREVLEDTLP